MTHAWCSDPARDAAVRAAEDGRSGPLPTLGEAIARPFAEGAERSSTVSKTGDGQSGLRTERITLEVTHDLDEPLADWLVESMRCALTHGESVRVVSDEERELPPTTKPATTENDYVPPAPVSRPAETRQTQAERVGGGWWFPKHDQPCVAPAPPPAPPRVHRGSGVFDANGDEVPWEGVVATLTEERDAAIRERDALRASSITQALTADRFASAVQEADKLRARVAELEAASGGGDGEAYMVTASGIPLYRQPPQPRGWLTGEEREAVNAARDYFDNDDHGDSECVFIARVLKQLLARSTPPEVVLPVCPFTPHSTHAWGWREAAGKIKKLLAAAGVAVKEAT
jgi:hypothetical protein